MNSSFIFFIQYIKDKFFTKKTNVIEPGETEFDYVPLEELQPKIKKSSPKKKTTTKSTTKK